MDNYNKQRYSANPGLVPGPRNRRAASAGDTSACINGCVMAILPCRGASPQDTMIRQPSLTSLWKEVTYVTMDFVNSISPPRAAVEQQLTRRHHHWVSVRVRCDVQRADVSMALWRNYAVKTDSVSTTAGLLPLLGGMRGVSARTGTVDTMPILACVDVFYRVLELLLGATWAAYPVR